MTTQLPSRLHGATLPTTVITWLEDNTALDLSGYTDWQLEARPQGSTTALTSGWPKTTGITASVAGVVTIVWAAADIGALVAGSYVLELTGTLGTGTRKHEFLIKIDEETA